MDTIKAARARSQARRVLAYRAWYLDAAAAEVPPLAILTDPRLHERERARQLRRAQSGYFDTVAPVGGRISSAA